jgi:predicted ribosome quality control (RQC) complex YloA/Tae2 family protein
MKTETFIFEKQEYTIHIGQSREENTELVNTSDPENIWFHVANAPSSHVVLKTTCKVKEVPLQVIKRCACLCKSHSKSKSVPKCDIIYTQIENIESTEIVGQVNTDSATLKFIKI